MKRTTVLLSFLFLIDCSLNDPLHLSSLLTDRSLRVVPNPSHPETPKTNQNVLRLARALKTIKASQNPRSSHTKHRRRNLQDTSKSPNATPIPAANMALSLGDTHGQLLGWLPAKLGLNITSNQQEATSLGIGTGALGYGVYSKMERDKRFNSLNFALQNKYKLNGIYLASLEDENIEVTYCNKRLSKILDKTFRHRKDMLAKLHFTVGV